MIDILMATYNGEEFITEQIDSILEQSNRDWHLYICDDCSTDATYEIANAFADTYPELITCVQNETNTGSAGANFLQMLAMSKGDYVMFCDQDDVWRPNKIEASVRAMKKMEERYGAETPMLVHSDLIVTDRNLDVIAPSLLEMQKLEGSQRTFEKQLVQNCVTGCTMLFNKALRDLLDPLPECYIMHDWWIALVASCFGKIGFLNMPTILYRQHSDNVEGAKDFRGLDESLKMMRNKDRIRMALELTYDQAGQFDAIYRDRMSEEQLMILEEYEMLPFENKLKRMHTMRKYGFFKTGWNRKIGQIFFQ